MSEFTNSTGTRTLKIECGTSGGTCDINCDGLSTEESLNENLLSEASWVDPKNAKSMRQKIKDANPTCGGGEGSGDG